MFAAIRRGVLVGVGSRQPRHQPRHQPGQKGLHEVRALVQLNRFGTASLAGGRGQADGAQGKKCHAGHAIQILKEPRPPRAVRQQAIDNRIPAGEIAPGRIGSRAGRGGRSIST
jgi:hypothetical protein